MTTTVFSQALGSDNSGDAGSTHREYVSPLLAASLGQIRITCQSSAAAGGLNLDHVSIGKASDANGNCVSTPTEITFNSGSHGFNIAQNANITSDWITFSCLSSDSLVLVFDFNASGPDGFRGYTTAGTYPPNDIFHASSASYNLQNAPSGSTVTAKQTWIVNLIETQAGAPSNYSKYKIVDVLI